jgi:hypothetical protein
MANVTDAVFGCVLTALIVVAGLRIWRAASAIPPNRRGPRDLNFAERIVGNFLGGGY